MNQSVEDIGKSPCLRAFQKFLVQIPKLGHRSETFRAGFVHKAGILMRNAK